MSLYYKYLRMHQQQRGSQVLATDITSIGKISSQTLPLQVCIDAYQILQYATRSVMTYETLLLRLVFIFVDHAQGQDGLLSPVATAYHDNPIGDVSFK